MKQLNISFPVNHRKIKFQKFDKNITDMESLIQGVRKIHVDKM